MMRVQIVHLHRRWYGEYCCAAFHLQASAKYWRATVAHCSQKSKPRFARAAKKGRILASVKHLLAIADLSPAELADLLVQAARLEKLHQQEGALPPLLARKQVALVFEKPSLRTKLAFCAAAADLGASSTFFGPGEFDLRADGELREEGADVARTLCGMADIIVPRMHADAKLQEMAAASHAPCINALSKDHHPTQALGDLYALEQRFGSVAGLNIVFFGDAQNNVACSLHQAATAMGAQVITSAPAGCELAGAKNIPDPLEAARGAQVLYTDTWISMGDEAESAARRQRFAPYSVGPNLMAAADKDAVFMHCLPAHRGEEVAAEVIDGPQSLVWPQAAARRTVVRAILPWSLGALGGA